MSTKRQKAFVNGVLQIVKVQFPDLYTQQIKGRRAKFIAENVPEICKEEGREVGHVNKDLQLLWALSEMFCKSLPDPLFPRDFRHASDASRVMGALARGTISKLCSLAFWEFVRQTQSSDEKNQLIQAGFIIRPDWSIDAITRDFGDGYGRDNLFDYLLKLILIQVCIHDLCMDVVRFDFNV